MKYLIVMMIALTGCAGTPLDRKHDKILECVKELIEMDSGTKDSYEVCKDLYSRKEK